MKRFCAKCGKEFEAESAAVRYCDECKAEVKKEWQAKQKQYAKDRALKLGLVNITVYKADRDAIKALAIDGKTVADVVKDLVAAANKTAKVDAPKKADKAEKTDKAAAKTAKK